MKAKCHERKCLKESFFLHMKLQVQLFLIKSFAWGLLLCAPFGGVQYVRGTVDLHVGVQLAGAVELTT